MTRAVSRVVMLLVVAAGLLAIAGPARPQSWLRGPQLATPESFDGSFQFCRVMYRNTPFGAGGGWSADYPSADINLSVRLSELTRIRVSRDARGTPNHLLVRPTDDELFQCPFILMAEVGSVHFDDQEVARLRAYFDKGGFLWVDDFWGSRRLAHWEQEIAKVFPRSEYPIIDVPLDHPIFRTQLVLNGVPQIPSIHHWLRSRGGTSEMYEDSAEVHTRAIVDTHGRIMVFVTHNTDISDSWEREGEDPNYFYQFSVDGYKLAVNVLLYAMTR